ncbi:hypothetical protein AB0M47_00270 [Hamadaea sp. NPDC051192]|uniref:glycoside hydrolase family 38 N-terminal domain-containing protein n=1 Tax=Hamadaea sp. NPDC051192 TaxID=3154940 RepID=UPI003417CB1C
MTTRLLRASLGSPTYDDMRATLRATHTRPVLSGRGVDVYAQPLPLFKKTPDGLVQAVRVAARGASVTATMAAQTERIADGASHDFWVPEADRPTAYQLLAKDLGETSVTVTAQRKWTVYVVHHSHLDIGYTDRQGVVLRNHLEYLDEAVELAGQTDDWPDDARFRWTVESALPVRRWLQARAKSAVDRFVDLARTGRIEVTAMPFQLHTEACSTEELHRLLRFTDALREEHGIPITSAMHTDVPGAVVGFVDALAASGVRYLSAAHNWAGRSVPFLRGGQELGRPFWWRSPAGNRVLVWFTDTPHGMAYMEGNVVGLAESFPAAVDLLPGYLDALSGRPFPYGPEAFGWSGLPEAQITRQPYPHDLLHLRVQGGNADNAGPSILPPSIIREWNAVYEYPRLRMATNTEFFAAAEESFGDRVPEHTGDWTDWWADGLGSGARPLGYARRAQHAVRHAETLHTLAGADAAPAVDAVYDKLGLFDEHTWGAANPWHDHEDGFDSGGLQWARKCELAYSGADDAEDLRHAGLRRLGARYGIAAGAEAGFLIHNPGPAARTDVATAFLPASTVPLDIAVSVVDGRTGEPVPHHEEVVRPEEWPTRPYGRRLIFPASDVPAFGAVRFDVVPGSGPVAVAEIGSIVENEYFRVEYDVKAGVIASVFDKRAGRELVNKEAYAGLNQYVYDKYSTAPHINHLSGHIEAHEHDALLAGRTLGRRPSISRAERTAAGETLEILLDGDGIDWLRTTITLPAGVPRVDITNTLYKRGAPAKESVFFAYPFATGAPKAWELTGGVGGPAAPTVPGAADHMQPIRHWVEFDDGELSVGWATLEAPLVMFGELYLPYAPFPPTVRPTPAEPGTVYSWALNNIWDTNFPAQQQGETTFRYAITSGPTDSNAGVRAAAGLVDPFLAVPLTGHARTAAVLSFVEIEHPDLHVSSLGRSLRGHSLVVYLRSVSADSVSTLVRLPQAVERAYLGTSLERDQVEAPVVDGAIRVTVPAGAFVALSVDLAASVGPSTTEDVL